MGTKSKLGNLRSDWEQLRIVETFPRIHHFSSKKFASKPPTLEKFLSHCSGREIEDENIQTINRALAVSEAIRNGDEKEKALEQAWINYPVCKR